MKTEWISVKDKLPRQGKEVLVRWKEYKGNYRTVIGKKWNEPQYPETPWHFSYYDCDGNNMLDHSQVTHWMPLPEPPKQRTLNSQTLNG